MSEVSIEIKILSYLITALLFWLLGKYGDIEITKKRGG